MNTQRTPITRIRLARLSHEDTVIYDDRVGSLVLEAQYRAADTVDFIRTVQRMRAKQGAVTAVYRQLRIEDQYAHDEVEEFARSRRVQLIAQLEPVL
jgi:uncharacterized protein (DUF2141 family)